VCPALASSSTVAVSESASCTMAAASSSCASAGPSEPTAPSRAQHVARWINVAEIATWAQLRDSSDCHSGSPSDVKVFVKAQSSLTKLFCFSTLEGETPSLRTPCPVNWWYLWRTQGTTSTCIERVALSRATRTRNSQKILHPTPQPQICVSEEEGDVCDTVIEVCN
jgi:hypothetical protein